MIIVHKKTVIQRIQDVKVEALKNGKVIDYIQLNEKETADFKKTFEKMLFSPIQTKDIKGEDKGKLLYDGIWIRFYKVGEKQSGKAVDEHYKTKCKEIYNWWEKSVSDYEKECTPFKRLSRELEKRRKEQLFNGLLDKMYVSGVCHKGNPFFHGFGPASWFW